MFAGRVWSAWYLRVSSPRLTDRVCLRPARLLVLCCRSCASLTHWQWELKTCCPAGGGLSVWDELWIVVLNHSRHNVRHVKNKCGLWWLTYIVLVLSLCKVTVGFGVILLGWSCRGPLKVQHFLTTLPREVMMTWVCPFFLQVLHRHVTSKAIR